MNEKIKKYKYMYILFDEACVPFVNHTCTIDVSKGREVGGEALRHENKSNLLNYYMRTNERPESTGGKRWTE